MVAVDFTRLTGFDWDEGNKKKNVIKHNVSNKECEEIFEDNPILFPDVQHSQEEERYIAYGSTKEKRLLFIVFTVRSDLIRVISAREQDKEEKRIYFKYKEAYL